VKCDFLLVCNSSMSVRTKLKLKFKLFCYRRSVSQSILVLDITVGHLRYSCCGAPSLTRGRVCNLLIQFAINLRRKSRRTHDHILLFNLRLLSSLFVASYDSQGYGGGILLVTRLHTEYITTKAHVAQYMLWTCLRVAFKRCNHGNVT
jgi:hypothetical protein